MTETWFWVEQKAIFFAISKPFKMLFCMMISALTVFNSLRYKFYFPFVNWHLNDRGLAVKLKYEPENCRIGRRHKTNTEVHLMLLHIK